MGPTLIAGHGMDLVYDDGFDMTEDLPALFAREYEVERFWGGDENVRRPPDHLLPLSCRRIPRADQGADLRAARLLLAGQAQQISQGHLQVALNVVGQGAQRRHVENVGLIAQRPGKGQAQEAIEASQERR